MCSSWLTVDMIVSHRKSHLTLGVPTSCRGWFFMGHRHATGFVPLNVSCVECMPGVQVPRETEINNIQNEWSRSVIHTNEFVFFFFWARRSCLFAKSLQHALKLCEECRSDRCCVPGSWVPATPTGPLWGRAECGCCGEWGTQSLFFIVDSIVWDDD